MMSEVARKILSKDPAAEAERKKEAAEAKSTDGHYHGKSSKTDPKVNKCVLRERGMYEETMATGHIYKFEKLSIC